VALTKAEVKILISLNNKRSRLKSNRFLVDGVRLLEEALAARYFPVIVYYSPSELNERGHALVRGFIDQKVQAQTISAKECAKISGTKASQGVIALFDVKKYNLQQQLKSRPRRILICDGIADPGNLGTLIRSATAFDFSLIIATEHSAEITNPKTVRASMGAFFKVPIVSGANGAELVTAMTEAGYRLYLADIAGVHIDRTDPPA